MMYWRDDHDQDYSFGTASIRDTFDKTVPIMIEFETLEILPGVPQEIKLIIPLNDLDSQRPTTLFTKWTFELGSNRSYSIEVNFTISW